MDFLKCLSFVCAQKVFLFFFFFSEKKVSCSLHHITVPLEANMVSNGVASYILKVSSIPKFLLMLCSVIISCFPFSIQIHRMGHVGSQADLMYPCFSRYHFSLKMICRFCISSLQRKAHTHIVKRIITSGSLSQLASATAAKALQLCPTLSDPMDGSPPSSSVHGIFQARVLEWGAIAFSAQLV